MINYNPVINCPHVTAPKLVLPVKQSSTEVSVQSEPAGIFGYVKYLVGKLGSNVVKYCSDYLGVTGALNVLENLKGHSLKNFAELCEKPVVNTEDWNKTLDGTLVIKDFERSDHITSTGNDVVIFKEKNIENDIISISASGFSYDDLRRAHHYDTNEISLSGNNNEFLDFEYVN